MRQVKPKEKHHAWAARGATSNGLVYAVLVRGGRRGTYLIVRRDTHSAWIDGAETLRSLAYAILREVPAKKKGGAK